MTQLTPPTRWQLQSTTTRNFSICYTDPRKSICHFSSIPIQSNILCNTDKYFQLFPLSKLPFCDSMKKVPAFSQKILKATMRRGGSGRRKPEFTTTGQTCIELTDSTASVEHILHLIKEWYGKGYILVTGDGVPLEESPETHGMLLQSHQLYTMLIIILLCRTDVYGNVPEEKVTLFPSRIQRVTHQHQSSRRPSTLIRMAKILSPAVRNVRRTSWM